MTFMHIRLMCGYVASKVDIMKGNPHKAQTSYVATCLLHPSVQCTKDERKYLHHYLFSCYLFLFYHGAYIGQGLCKQSDGS